MAASNASIEFDMHFAIRVDASDQIGSGHVMRCLTLADVLRKQGGNIRFVSRHMPLYLREKISSHGHDLALLDDEGKEPPDELAHARWLGTSQADDARGTALLLADRAWDWLIVDHYALDARWETELKKVCGKILVIDDLADRVHDCDVLVDQNLYSDMLSRYADKVAAGCQILAGPRYALLRPEFAATRQHCGVRRDNVRRILVAFGGVDAKNYTGLAVAVLAALQNTNFQIDVVIALGHPQREQLLAKCAELGYVCHVQTDRMADLMAAADFAIGAGGVTTWERCCLGLPALAICVADNQRRQITDAAIAGLLYTFNAVEDVESSIRMHVKALVDNPALRSLLSSNGMRAVDGRGVLRIAAALGGSGIVMREARNEDSRNLHAWRNHVAIRAVSRHTDSIAWEVHQQWLNSVLADANRVLLIGTVSGTPVGVVRYDCRDGDAEVSIYLLPDKLSSGFGAELLQAGEQWLRRRRPDIKNIRAQVLGDNDRSMRLFSDAGYVKESSCFSKRLKQNA